MVAYNGLDKEHWLEYGHKRGERVTVLDVRRLEKSGRVPTIKDVPREFVQVDLSEENKQ